MFQRRGFTKPPLRRKKGHSQQQAITETSEEKLQKFGRLTKIRIQSPAQPPGFPPPSRREYTIEPSTQEYPGESSSAAVPFLQA